MKNIVLFLSFIALVDFPCLCMEKEENKDNGKSQKVSKKEVLIKINKTAYQLLSEKNENLKTQAEMCVNSENQDRSFDDLINKMNDKELKDLHEKYINLAGKNGLLNELAAVTKSCLSNNENKKFATIFHPDINSKQPYIDQIFYSEVNGLKPDTGNNAYSAYTNPQKARSHPSDLKDFSYAQVAMGGLVGPFSDHKQMQETIMGQFFRMWSFVFLKGEKFLLQNVPGAKYYNRQRKSFLNPDQNQIRTLKNEQRLDTAYAVLLASQSMYQEQQVRRINDITKP